MDLNKEQLESIMESAREHFDGEIPDELMEVISGGREVYYSEQEVLFKERARMAQAHQSRQIDNKAYAKFNIAVSRYLHHIRNLKMWSSEELFVYEKWAEDGTG